MRPSIVVMILAIVLIMVCSLLDGKFNGFILLFVTVGVVWTVWAWSIFRKWDDLLAELQSKHFAIMNGKGNKEDIESFRNTYDSCLDLLRVCKGAGSREVIDKMKDEIMFRTAAGEMLPASTELERLAELRRKGFISDDEFKAFSERFTVSAGEKALKIIEAIHSLHDEHNHGSLSLGNYHAAVWSLLDKMDRKI